MIDMLFGNQNVSRILLFLFVNERSYASEIRMLLGVALTPVQNALSRLERGEILLSYFEKNRKIYQFNPQYSFRWELELLLKKAYTLLPAEEKKRYCFVHKERVSVANEQKREKIRKKALSSFWMRLLSVTELNLTVRSRKETCTIIRTGKALISVEMPNAKTAIFEEKGSWFVDRRPETNFKNIFCWSLEIEKALITLSHLRHGKNAPVFLFHLTATGSNRLESVDAHLCKQDTYLGTLHWDKEAIVFYWRIIGPDKNDELIYRYR